MEYANKVITIYKIKGGKEMKKIIILIMHISLIMFLFTSCAKTNQFTKKIYTTDDLQIQKINIEARDRQIEILSSNDDLVHIEYFENEQEQYSILIDENKTLDVKLENNKSWLDYFGQKASMDNRKIILSIPNHLLIDLVIETTNENVSIAKEVSIDNLSVSVNGGNIIFDKLNACSDIVLNVKNGDITGSILGSYDDYSINCQIKKGETNLPSKKDGGYKQLDVIVNNGDAKIEINK